MDTTITFTLPSPLVRRLLQCLEDKGDTVSQHEAVRRALEMWLAHEEGQRTPPPGLAGYQWKSLFLPEGSKLKMSALYGEVRYAEVIGDQLLCEGRPTTPNRFANAGSRSIRNAWYTLLVRRPQDQSWKSPAWLRRQIEAQ